MKYYLGCDIGGTSVKYGLFDTEGTLLEKWSTETAAGENGALLFDGIARNTRQADERLKEAYGTEACLAAVGMGIPGPVGRDGFVKNITNQAVRDVCPAEELKKRVPGIQAFAVNDANAAVLGELWKGAGQHYDSVCMVTLGTGIGGGIVLGGKIVGGCHGYAGEIGHICVEPEETELCGCGARGCVEQYASAPGIARMAERLLAAEPALPSVLRGHSPLTAKEVCDAAAAGDAAARRSLDRSLDKLALALSQAAVILDPAVFIIGGGVSKAGVLITEPLRQKINGCVHVMKDYSCRVLVSSLGSDAGIYGAARLAMTESCP